MERVRIVPGKTQKYVLVTVKDDGEPAVLLWGNPDVEWHKEIVAEITNAGYEVVRVEGGGRIHINPETRSLHIWDRSTNFGAAPSELVRMVLEVVYPEHEISEKEPSQG